MESRDCPRHPRQGEQGRRRCFLRLLTRSPPIVLYLFPLSTGREGRTRMPAPCGSSTACHKGRAWTVEPPELERVVGQSGDGLHWVGTSEWHAETRRVVRTGAGSGCRTGWARRRLGVGMSAWHAPAVARPVVQERHVGMASRLGSERFGLG